MEDTLRGYGARGLKKCQDPSFRFSNFARCPLLLRIIEHDSAGIEFAQAGFFSFLFSLRVPSETLVLRRAYSSDPMETFCPHPDEALMGVRTVGGEPFLFAKFSWRKNMASGCILRRPCFCNLTNRKAALICPVHVSWPLIRCRVDPGKPIFSAVNRRNFNRILKVVLAKLRIPEADRYSSHASRRGTSQELKESGSPPGLLSPLLECGTLLHSADMWIYPVMLRWGPNSSSMLTWTLNQRTRAPSVRHWVFSGGETHWPVFPDRFSMGIGDFSLQWAVAG